MYELTISNIRRSFSIFQQPLLKVTVSFFLGHPVGCIEMDICHKEVLTLCESLMFSVQRCTPTIIQHLQMWIPGYKSKPTLSLTNTPCFISRNVFVIQCLNLYTIKRIPIAYKILPRYDVLYAKIKGYPFTQKRGDNLRM